MKTKVSVIIPSFNHSKFVESSIRSVLAQSGDFDLELIVVDDCSTDDSDLVIESLRENFNFKYIKNPTNQGLNFTIKNGVLNSTGNFLCFLASDDLFVKNKIQKQLNYLTNYDCDCVYSSANILNDEGQIIYEQNLLNFSNLLKRGKEHVIHLVCTDDTSGPLLQSSMLKREAAFHMLDVQSKYRSDDWVVLLSLLDNFKVGFINEPLFSYRLHSDNTHKKYWRMLSYRFEVVTSYVAVNHICYLPESLSNLFLSQASILFRHKLYSLSFRFLLASLSFGIPYRKFLSFLKRKF